MSILTLGTRCAHPACSLVDYLPVHCASCDEPFCGQHLRVHACAGAGAGGSGSGSGSGPGKLWKGERVRCGVSGCEGVALEGWAGREVELELGDGAGSGTEGAGRRSQGAPESQSQSQSPPQKQVATDADGQEEDVAKRVRCACGGAFCAKHRHQAAHSCPIPEAHEARATAALDRRAHAQTILAQTFPQYAGRTLPKPPPPPAPKITREKPSPLPRMPNAYSSPVPVPVPEPVPEPASDARAGAVAPKPASEPEPEPEIKTKTRAKTREDKLWEVHVRKIRLAAAPLGQGMGVPEGQERRFVEWGVASAGDVRAWLGGMGKWGGKVERVYIRMDMSVGRVLDEMVDKSKTPRPKGNEDASRTLSLMNLDAKPPGPRTATRLDLPRSLASQTEDGTMVLLVRGWDGQAEE